VNPARPVLWADPGGMTGVAVWWPVPGAEPGFIAAEYDFTTAASQVDEVCKHFGDRLDVGWEDFIIRPKTPPSDAHHALEMIGVIRWAMLRNGCRQIGPAQPEQRKAATRDMLEAIGWWRPGKDDAQSAAAHMLSWMLRTGQVPDRQAVVLAALRSDDQGR
jgi:hypothetical protein